jgi:hypothetical protein
MLQLTSMARPSIAMALRLFLSFWSFTFLSFWIPPSPLRFSFSGLPVFRFVSLSVEKSGNCFVAFVAQMMDGPTHGKEGKMVWSIRRESCPINFFPLGALPTNCLDYSEALSGFCCCSCSLVRVFSSRISLISSFIFLYLI